MRAPQVSPPAPAATTETTKKSISDYAPTEDYNEYSSGNHDHEELEFIRMKKAFEKSEKEWKKEIEKLDRERQELNTIIKQLDNEVNDNYTKVSHGNPYSHMDAMNRETLKQKDNQVRITLWIWPLLLDLNFVGQDRGLPSAGYRP